MKKEDDELPLPSKSQIIRQDENPTDKKESAGTSVPGKHDPVIEKAAKSFSIKELINDEATAEAKENEKHELDGSSSGSDTEVTKIELTPEALESSWKDFTGQLQGEGPRIISMFKSINPEMESNQTIRIHVHNATQKDTFILDYKQRFINFLGRKYLLNDIDIETLVDISETNDIIYSDEQKFNHLFNKYPIMREIKKTFNLDIN